MLAFTNAMLVAAMPVQVGTVPLARPAPLVAEAPHDQQPQVATPPATPASPAATVDAPPVPVPAEPPAQASEPAKPTHSENPENDVIVTAARRPPPGDPFQAINAKSFAATEAVDKAFIGPVSLAYKHHVPSPIRSGIHNFLYNLREPVVFVNFVLQLKIGKAAETVGRFAINSTAGVGGVMDIAKRKPFHLPRRGNGFADTLGYWGVPNGPFMFLPIVGPTTVRDLFGGFVDRLILPVGVGTPFNSIAFGAPAGALGALDHRADFDDELHILHDNVPDPYGSSRDFYLRRRQAEIDFLHGRGGAAAPMSENPLGYIAPSAPPPQGATGKPAGGTTPPPPAKPDVPSPPVPDRPVPHQ